MSVQGSQYWRTNCSSTAVMPWKFLAIFILPTSTQAAVSLSASSSSQTMIECHEVYEAIVVAVKNSENMVAELICLPRPFLLLLWRLEESKTQTSNNCINSYPYPYFNAGNRLPYAVHGNCAGWEKSLLAKYLECDNSRWLRWFVWIIPSSRPFIIKPSLLPPTMCLLSEFK